MSGGTDGRGQLEGEPLAEIADDRIVTVLPLPAGTERGDIVPLKPEVLSQIAPLFEHLPRVAAAAGLASVAGRYLVRFSPEIQKGFNAGRDVIARTKDGQLLAKANNAVTQQTSGLGRLDQVARLPALAGAVWQLLAIVTAQKFLSDIQGKLESIDRQLGLVRAWQKNALMGNIQGNFQYLLQIEESIRVRDSSGPQLDSQRNQLEAIARESLQNSALIRATCQSAHRDLMTRRLSASAIDPRLNLKANTKGVLVLLEEYAELARLETLNTAVRAAALQLRTVLDPASVTGIAEGLTIALDQHDRAVEVLAEDFRKRLPELKAVYRLGKSDRAAQNKVNASVRHLLSVTRAECSSLRQAIDRNFLGTGVALEVAVDEAGAVTQVARLPDVTLATPAKRASPTRKQKTTSVKKGIRPTNPRRGRSRS